MWTVESLLELHLETFSLSVSSISFCFFAMALSYTSITLLVTSNLSHVLAMMAWLALTSNPLACSKVEGANEENLL